MVQYDNCPIVEFRTSVAQVEVEALDKDSSEEDESDTLDSEDEPEPRLNVLTLEKKDPKSVPLSEYRATLYNRIISEIKRLFDVKKSLLMPLIRNGLNLLAQAQARPVVNLWMYAMSHLFLFMQSMFRNQHRKKLPRLAFSTQLIL